MNKYTKNNKLGIQIQKVIKLIVDGFWKNGKELKYVLTHWGMGTLYTSVK